MFKFGWTYSVYILWPEALLDCHLVKSTLRLPESCHSRCSATMSIAGIKLIKRVSLRLAQYLLSSVLVYLCCELLATLTHFLYFFMPWFWTVAKRCSYSFSAEPTSFPLAFSQGTESFRALRLTSDAIQPFYHFSGIILVWANFSKI